jgi:NADPH:quinone reductase-like Zn-dependent oxidoreductase
VLPLAAAAEAHRMLASRHAGGKIVLDVTSS